jgi:hypothetical protein
VEARRVWTAIDCGNPDQEVFDTAFGVFDEHVEVPVVVEHPGLEQLEFGAVPAATPILVGEPCVRRREPAFRHTEVGFVKIHVRSGRIGVSARRSSPDMRAR